MVNMFKVNVQRLQNHINSRQSGVCFVDFEDILFISLIPLLLDLKMRSKFF